MKKFVMGISAMALMLGAGAANAADLHSQAPATGVDWNGLYFGATLGWSNSAAGQIQDVNPNYSNTSAWQSTAGGNGFLFGGQIGYDFRLHDNIVLGFAADVKGNFAANATCADANCATNQNGSPALAYNIAGLGAITARIGFLPSEKAMIYVLGGPAIGAVVTHHWDREDMDNTNLFTGFTLGAGAEMMVVNNVSLGVEGRYYDLGSKAIPDQSGEAFNYHPKAWTASVTANYHF